MFQNDHNLEKKNLDENFIKENKKLNEYVN
jgi:hypothetical protein